MQDNKKQAMQVNLEVAAFALTNAQVIFDQELFVFVMMSGNTARRYVASPQHAKRVAMLLQRQLEKYEKQHGEIKTSLPGSDGKTSETRKEFGFETR